MVRLFGREDRRREQLLSAYVDGEVTAEEAREVEELLASSEDARRELAELQATVDLVRGLPELELSRSFALDAAPENRWTLWWPSVRTTGLAASVATMLLVGLVAGDMLDVLVQARFGGDDLAEMDDYAFDDSAFASAAAPAVAPESAAGAAMDAPASPEPEAAVMKSVASQDESAAGAATWNLVAPTALAEAADAPPMAPAQSSEEPLFAKQQATTRDAPQEADAAESSEEPLFAKQQPTTQDAPQEADAAESSEEPLFAKQQATTRDAPVPSEESQVDEVFDDPEGDGITLPLVELQVVAAVVAVILGGATLVAVRRRRRSVL